MQLKIISEKESPLLGRKEIEIEASYEKATPSAEEIKKTVASKLKLDEASVVIKKIQQSFGSRRARITTYIYNSIELMKKLEAKKEKKKKEKKKEEAK